MSPKHRHYLGNRIGWMRHSSPDGTPQPSSQRLPSSGNGHQSDLGSGDAEHELRVKRKEPVPMSTPDAQTDDSNLVTTDTVYVSPDGGTTDEPFPKPNVEYDFCVDVANAG